MKKILLLLISVCAIALANAQTHSTVQDGDWSDPNTWSGGDVPPTTLNPSHIVNINHHVIYDEPNDLIIDGGQLIITQDTLRFPNDGSTGTGRSIMVTNDGINVGFLSVTNGGIIMPIFLTNGNNNSGNIKAEGGRIVFINSYAEMGQNWEATASSHRKYINSCLKLGENYTNTNSTDTLQGVCIELGLHGSGNFQNDGGTIRFNTTAVLLRGTSGNFSNSSNPASQILTFGIPGVAIIALDIPGNLENSSTWDATVGEWCVDGSITGSQSGQIDFLGPENCAFVNAYECECEPLGSTLPVTLKSFTAQRNRLNVVLVWETVAELNNRGFNVQRRIGAGNWENVGFVPSNTRNTNTNSLVRYEFTDYNPTKGMTQYRLQQLDVDGKSAHSNIRAVRGIGQVSSIIVYPNPSNDGKVNIVFDDTNVIRNVSLMDINGRKLRQWKNVANNNIQIDNLAPGFYSVQIENIETGDQVVEKIIVNKR